MVATSQFTISVINDGQDGSPGAQGPQGISVIGSREQWFLSTSNTGLAGSPNTIDVNGVSVLVGQWTYTEPAVIPDGYYLWGRIENTFAGVDDAEIASSDGLLASSDGTLACGYYSSPVSQYSDAIYRSVISGIKSMVDYNRKAITDKVWETDIENHVYGADDGDGGYTMSSISDRMTQTEQDISGITTTVSEVQSQVEADGTTVQTLQRNYTAFQQTMNTFKTTVEQSYAQTSYVDQQIGNIKVGGDNLYIIADQVPGYLHQSNGSISTQNATGKEFTSAYIPVKEGENIIIQSWCTPLTEAGVENPGYSWLAYQFFSDDDPVTPVGDRVAKWGYSSGSGAETTADGKERLMYKVVAPANANYIRTSYRSYEDGYAMVEKATTPSEYAIATADLENESSQIRTIAEQTADKFTWLVESGDSSSNFTLTDRAAQLVAQYINLNGTVTFSAFDVDTQNALTSGAELIVGTQTSSTSAWTGKSTKLKSLASGTRISYKLPYASTSTAVTLNLTLNNNTTTGAKNVYYLNDTRLTTQYGANSIVELIYDGSAWRVINPYSDQNTYDRTRYQQPIKAGSVAIAAGNIIVAGANNVGTYTHLKRGQAFDTTYPILYAGSAISANSTGTDNYLIVPMGISTTQSGSYTAYKAVYIKGTLSGTTFTPISTTPLTQTIPTSADNYHYILLGTMYSTTEMYLLGEHPIFAYYNGGFKTVAQIAAEAATSASSAVTTAGQANDNASAALTAVNSSIKSTTMHYLATSASSDVTTSTSGWDTSPQSITATNRYLWTYQTITKVDNTTYDTDPVISGVWGNTGSQGSQGDQGVSVTKVEQLYRTSSSTTAPTAPSSVVTSTSTSYNTWTLAMPTYNTSYPYYYTCTQTTYSNGNHTWTTVARSKAIEDANTTANTASANASDAVSVANTANGNASAAVTTATNANNTATTALNGIKAFTGTCTTDAATPAKVVTCSDNTFAMTNGVVITVIFSNASTADAPTLNVKSLGEKPIYFDKAITSDTNRFRWKAGSVITFQYNGTNWVVLDYKNIEYTSSSTASDVPIKTNSSTDGTFVLCRGTTINVYFSEANTANVPKLNIDGTGEIPIYYKGAEVNSSNKYLWDAGSTFTFTYNGATRWYMTDGGSKIVKDYAQTAVDWVGTNGSSVITAKDIISNWATDATSATTTIEGGLIRSHTITSDNLATDAIISNGYTADTSSVYSTVGTFLDLANGNIKSPTFAVDNINGMAYIDGTITAKYLYLGSSPALMTSSGGILTSSEGALVGNAIDQAKDYLIYDGDNIMIKTNNFQIDAAGNVSMAGKVEAQSGSIGGWEISDDNLHYGSPIGSSGSVYLIPQGSTTWHSVGGSYETDGWVITAGENFGVTKDGALYANDANITGTFTITDGGIGGMTIDSDTISTTTSGMSSNTSKYAFWAGETNGSYGTTSTDAKFKVGHDGKLTASNADITGKITASDGTIGGWKIGEGRLYYSTAETPQVGDSNSVFLMPNGTSSNVTIAGVASRGWVITAGDSFGVTRTGSVYANYGKIGGVTLSGGNIYAYNNTGSGTTAIPSFSLTSGGVLAIGGNNGITVDEDGVLSIPAVRITGTLTANQIAAGAITASKLSVTIGGNNLLRDSHANKTGSSTPWIWSYGPNPPKSGDKLTFQVKGSSLGSSQQIVTFGVTHTISLVYNSTTGTYVGTFTLSVSNSSDTYFRFNPGSTSATCDWVKLEYGDIPTPWSPSPDEAAGFDVDATAIHTSGVAVTSNDNNSVAFSSADFTRTINSISRSGLRLAIGAHFGVTGTGALYSSSGVIGGLTIGSNYMSYGTTGQDASTFIGAVNYGLSHNNAKATVAGQTLDTWRLTVGSNFGVTGSGMYATGGKIGGFTIGTNSIVGDNISIYSNSTNQCIEMSATNNVRTTYVGTYAITNQNSSGKSVSMGIDDSVGGTGITIAGNYNTDEIMFMSNANSNSGLYNKTKGQWGIRYNPTSGEAMLYGMQYGVRLVSPPTTATDQTSYFEPRTYLNSAADDKVYLGRSGARWKAVYAVNGTIQTSDERLKTIHRYLGEDHKKLFMELRPIEYSFISNPDEKHFGLGAQTTEAAMKNLGFGTEYNIVEHSVYDEKDKYGRHDTYNMNYTEALMLAIPVVQDHEKEIAKLKAKINELETKLSQLTQ